MFFQIVIRFPNGANTVTMCTSVEPKKALISWLFSPFCLRLFQPVSHLVTYIFRIPKTYQNVLDPRLENPLF